MNYHLKTRNFLQKAILNWVLEKVGYPTPKTFKVNDTPQVTEMQEMQEAQDLISMLLFQTGDMYCMKKLMCLAVSLVQEAFKGAVASYNTTNDPAFPDVTDFSDLDYDSAVLVCEKLGVSCQFLCWVQATALSILGYIVPGISEVRYAKCEFQYAFAYLQVQQIKMGIHSEKISEWPELVDKPAEEECSDEETTDRSVLRIPNVPTGDITDSFRAYIVGVCKDLSKNRRDLSSSFVARLHDDWQNQEEVQDDSNDLSGHGAEIENSTPHSYVDGLFDV